MKLALPREKKSLKRLNAEVFFREYCLLLFSSTSNVVKTCNNIETIWRVGNMEKFRLNN